MEFNFLNLFKQNATDKNINVSNIEENLKKAIVNTYERLFPETVVETNLDLENNKFEMYEVYEVVDDSKANSSDFNDYNQMLLSKAQIVDKNATVGSKIKIKREITDPILEQFDFITALSKSFANLNKSTNNKNLYEKYKNLKGTIVNGVVDSAAHNTVVVKLDNGAVGEGYGLELNPREKLVSGLRYSFYVTDVIDDNKSASSPIKLSRSSPELVKYIITKEVPEIAEGVVVIKRIARVPGFRTKVLVSSTDANVNPLSAIFGSAGVRIKAINTQLNEPIDIIKWEDDFDKLIINVCAPQAIVGYNVTEPSRSDERKHLVIACEPDVSRFLVGPAGNNTKLLSRVFDMTVEIVSTEQMNKLIGLGYKYNKPDYVANPMPVKRAKRPEGSAPYTPREGGAPYRPRNSINTPRKPVENNPQFVSDDISDLIDDSSVEEN